jgi:hypothetical protein
MTRDRPDVGVAVMPEITINGVPTIPQRDGTRGTLEVVNERILRLTCKVDVTDRRLADIHFDMSVPVEIHGDHLTNLRTYQPVSDQPRVLYALLMRIVRSWREPMTFNEHWLVLECESIRDRSGAPTLEDEFGV